MASGKTRVLLVGSGGVGTMASYALEIGGQAEVTSILRSNYDAVQKSGFSIDSIQHGNGIKGFRPTQILNKIPDVEKEGLQPFDYVIVATKNIPDVRPTVLDIIEPAVTPETTTVVLLQNGLNIEQPVIERFPTNVVLSGVSIISATEQPHGVIKHEFTDSAKIGPFPAVKVAADVSEAKARRLVEMYNACGKVDWQYDENVLFTRWRKLVYNASFNSVSAILHMDVARMRMSRHVIDDLVRPAMLEIVATAKAAGIELPEGIDDFMITLDPADEHFMPSMGQDAVKVGLAIHCR
jgi:2-dehydropantoate 2-reductase